MASVDIVNVKKSFDRAEILRGVSIHIQDGEFVVLVGPSGCGKSTLLRMIAGLETISSGEIKIGDQLVNDFTPRDRDVAMVFQNYALYPHMTVAGNMAFSLKLRGIDRAEIDRRVARAAEILGLTALLDRRPRHLSGGQRQRVAMGRAIVRDPRVFLFDEPLSNLDAKLRVAMRSEIKDLHQRLKTTMVYVTHDQIEAMTMADRIVVMRDGRVEQTGEPLELYDTPANLFVAGFIGSPAMNFLKGTIEVADRTGFVADTGTFVPLPPSPTHGELAGRPLVLGIRPEHLRIADGAAGGFEVGVKIVEPTGSETQVTATANGADLIALFRERHTVRQGDQLHLTPTHFHLFDGQNGARLASVSI
ncbi:sn-glycerol-3-phosphate ABC transporter ATP-binding protein UgpC [Siculibacillus lacustris]|uniref:sn-glycerol-3-phosphate ABC transporter ATP-binding protein UgpC n=1 Tax=Siculibacillus lacustris TaxID=1549641 RepID=A0A4Q9VMX3_9HYPH|nr:sn-glycerol-3-phosphate ABC transporter ATP-binding protein UgpC [Siculibacillus lacustris]TBW36982.1 sn-glycerol-3-phosphate ABC transporter ATP-binding protein UgpC [Siculibacillus lacustris]